MHPAAVCPMTAARVNIQRDHAMGSARDAAAARVICDGAIAGDPAVAEFASEAQQLLGIARVRRGRAARLGAAAAQAAVLGKPKLSMLGSDAANEELAEAERLEGVVIRAVRDSHDSSAAFGIGWVTPEEARMLRRKSASAVMTQGQREASWARALERLLQSAGNYSSFGADASDEQDEIDRGAESKIGEAAMLFGGDLPAVFGEDCYTSFGKIFEVSEERLNKRLARKKKRLAKVESKLEGLEDAGKSGLRVRILRIRMNVLEKGIARIEGKLDKLDVSAEEVDEAEQKTAKNDKAERQVLREASKDEGDDDSDADLDFLESSLGADGYDDDFAGESDLVAAVDLFGMTAWRQRMIERRLARLQSRLEVSTSQTQQERLSKRIARLQAKIQTSEPAKPVGDYESNAYSTDLELDDIDLDTYDLLQGIDPEDEDLLQGDPSQAVHRDLVGATFGQDGMGSQMMIGFFERRAGHYGGADLSVDDEETFGGFWESVKGWFSKVKGKREDSKGSGKLPRQVLASKAKQAKASYMEDSKVETRKARRAELKKNTRARIKKRRDDWKRWRGTKRRQRKAGRAVLRDPVRVAAMKDAKNQLSRLRRERRTAYSTAYKAARGGLVEANPAAEPAAIEFREIVDGSNGEWVYHQYADGSIFFSDAPTAAKNTTIHQGDPYWDVITAEINRVDGVFPGGKAGAGSANRGPRRDPRHGPRRGPRRGPRPAPGSRPHRLVPSPGRVRRGSASSYCDC